MLKISKYLVPLVRTVVLLFFLGNSGFTSIVHLCSMKAAECCDTNIPGDDNMCQETPVAAPQGEHVQSMLECHTNAVVGGLVDVQALVEKDSGSKTPSLVVHPVLIPLQLAASLCQAASWFSSTYTSNVSPPSVEKYVLNSTFLI